MSLNQVPSEEHVASPTFLATEHRCELHCCSDKMPALPENRNDQITALQIQNTYTLSEPRSKFSIFSS